MGCYITGLKWSKFTGSFTRSRHGGNRTHRETVIELTILRTKMMSEYEQHQANQAKENYREPILGTC